MFSKRALLIKIYGWSEHYAMWGMPSIKSWAYYTWAAAQESGTFLRDGYLAQEIERILEEHERRTTKR